MTAPLPCGHDPARLIDLAVDGRGDSSVDGRDDGWSAEDELAGCPYCTARLDELRERWSAVRSAAATPVGVPSDLVTRSIAAVRALRGGPAAPSLVISEPGGSLRVGRPALLLLTRQLAIDLLRRSSGVRLRGVELHDDQPTVRIAARYGQALPDVGRRVGTALQRALHTQLGPAAPPVHVEIVDLFEPG